MSYFWDYSNPKLVDVELIDAYSSTIYDYSSFSKIIEYFQKIFIFSKKSLITLLCDNSPINISCYLAALRSGHTVQLINSSTDTKLVKEIIQIYKPDRKSVV